MALAVLFTIWPWTPLVQWIDPAGFQALLVDPERPLLTVVALLGLFTVSAVVLMPVTPIILLAMLALGPAVGALCSAAGMLMAAQIGFGLGRVLGHRDVLRLRAGPIYEASCSMGERGVLKTAILRVLPVAHFSAISFLLGVSHLRWSHFIGGTLLGSGVTLVVIGLMFDRTAAALNSPTADRLAVLALVTVLLLALLVYLQRCSRDLIRGSAASDCRSSAVDGRDSC